MTIERVVQLGCIGELEILVPNHARCTGDVQIFIENAGHLFYRNLSVHQHREKRIAEVGEVVNFIYI